MANLRAAAIALALCLSVAAQTPAFDVASVKAAAPPEGQGIGRICLMPCTPGETLGVEGSRVEIRYMPLAKLIVAAYRLKPYQLSGPAWMEQERFDILAKMPEGASLDQVPGMLQALLAERFGLKVQRESKEQPLLVLVAAKNGPKLPEAAADADVPIPAKPASRFIPCTATPAFWKMATWRLRADRWAPSGAVWPRAYCDSSSPS